MAKFLRIQKAGVPLVAIQNAAWCRRRHGIAQQKVLGMKGGRMMLMVGRRALRGMQWPRSRILRGKWTIWQLFVYSPSLLPNLPPEVRTSLSSRRERSCSPGPVVTQKCISTDQSELQYGRGNAKDLSAWHWPKEKNGVPGKIKGCLFLLDAVIEFSKQGQGLCIRQGQELLIGYICWLLARRNQRLPDGCICWLRARRGQGLLAGRSCQPFAGFNSRLCPRWDQRVRTRQCQIPLSRRRLQLFDR